MNYEGEEIELVESSEVKEGVICEVYAFVDTKEKDLERVFVQAGHTTPLQKVVKGEKTIEQFVSGVGKLVVTSNQGEVKEYNFPSDIKEVGITIGETMQWQAEEDLVLYEICWPPYEKGRFEVVGE